MRWISTAFADAPTVTGTFTGRTDIEAPVWVRDTQASDAKYGFSIKTGKTPIDRRVALTNARIVNLRSPDQYGAGIRTSPRYPDIELYLSDVNIEPNWPAWGGYDRTNYDGIVLDGAKAIYAQNLTIRNWNADSAIDNKARISQFANLQISGNGHRPLRYWQPGPHYLVDSVIDNPGGGTLIWFRNCDAVTLYVYRSIFNGFARLSEEMMQCEEGDTANIVYLAADPRRTGEMHPMFATCDS